MSSGCGEDIILIHVRLVAKVRRGRKDDPERERMAGNRVGTLYAEIGWHEIKLWVECGDNERNGKGRRLADNDYTGGLKEKNQSK